MNITEIALSLNELAEINDHPFANIQEIRRRNGNPPRTWKPFARFSIKDEYAFHAGGRKELQFNIGHDEIDGEDVFRFGVGFSLREDRTLHNSKAEFKPIIERFNSFLAENPAYFDGFKMWYYAGDQFGSFFDNVQPIYGPLFEVENFIFIGKYFEKNIAQVSAADLETVLSDFDYLLPLYEFAQFGAIKEKRVARICWNENGWVLPSGRHGKSIYKDSHEAIHGFGHEEWLFDTGKLINGYHYGFLEPIRKQQDAFAGQIYDISLYSINGETKKRFWVGEIHDVEVLNSDSADDIKAEYERRGWLKEMEQQIRAAGASEKQFLKSKGINLFNIRYKPATIKVINDPYLEVDVKNPVQELSRYAFAHYRDEFHLEKEAANLPFEFVVPGNNDDDNDTDNSTEKSSYAREPKIVEIKYLHKRIVKGLKRKLREIYGYTNVTPEHPSGYEKNRIDMVVRGGNELIFFEIKTYPSLKTSIREALGQIMEYSLWSDSLKAKKMIIVTQKHPEIEEAKTYFKHLRNTFNLPLYYQWYDCERDILSEVF